MGITVAGLIATAKIVGGIAAAGSSAYGVKRGIAQKGEMKHAQKKTRTEAEARKEKERLALKKEKSPGQRLLGGRPTLG